MRQFIFLCFAFCSLLFVTACQPDAAPPRSEQITQLSFTDVRLGDGVPLGLNLSISWQPTQTQDRASRPDTVLQQLMRARSTEAIRQISNSFMDVDSVFSTQREDYILTIKDELERVLPEPDLAIKEIIVLNVQFPQTFTNALEEIGLQELRESQINKQKELAIVQAAANEEKTKAEGKVAIAQAEAEGRLQAIQARTEADRRRSELARAETAAAVARTQAGAEADRLRKLKNVEVEKQRELELIAVELQRELDKVALEQELAFAQLCEANPTYASFLVNKELAGNVEIAVLPAGGDTNMFSGLLQSRLPGKAASADGGGR